MNFLEQVAIWIGVELNKQFQVYDMEETMWPPLSSSWTAAGAIYR